ncbi:helix-turn-helix domain-containing protein [Terrilactibacillus sp. BCM23-1]|uniref:Helix-turn-helix domain-containing protein n=1 Tax=Terrilactibacillus tamarindi TaxID=2599694 RepID=A0A6N8CLM5_9BACI|nr:helix-turn-helix transcriptional regulator [Terrilactibacillus tamarindi]MTT30711.1 helix-turn-helix domain-containing protein [Terrilactibacillus tamarindi]
MLKNLEELRKSRDWSLQDIADKLGIAKSTYAGYESGYRRPPLHALIQIANLFDVSIDYLLAREHTIDITDRLLQGKQKISIDHMVLDQEECDEFVAFIRAKRDIKKKLR